MRAVVLALTLAFVAGQPHHIALDFKPGETYIYKYETNLTSGLPEKDLPKAGLRFKCIVVISVDSQNTTLLKLHLKEPQIYEYDGEWRQDTKLSSELAKQADAPIKFEYAKGLVGKMFIPPEASLMLRNIYKAIASIFLVNIKKTQNVYELNEAGTQGVCKTLYAITEDTDKRIILTKTRDMNQCQEQITRSEGLAYIENFAKRKEDNKNLRGTTSYNYILKSNERGVEIQEMRSNELIQFLPFSEKEGAAQTETKQSLIALNDLQYSLEDTDAQYGEHTSLKYEFPTELIHSPIQMIRTNNEKALIEETLNHLVAHNVETVHQDAPLKYLELILLLRKIRYEDLETLWDKYGKMAVYRQWLLDSIIVTATPASLRFIRQKIVLKQLEIPEVAQALIASIHMVKLNAESIELFQTLLSNIEIKAQLREMILLGYGTMIYRHCSEMTACPVEVLQPIIDHFSKDDLTKEENKILYLKALGNAGHPASLKRITKYLPIPGTVGGNQPTIVHIEAIAALRNIAKKEPKMVQELALQLFMDKALAPELRMLSLIVLFETRPSMVLVTTLASFVKREKNLQVASFTYSYIKSLTKGNIHATVAAACNVAIKILGSRLERLSFYYSKVIHMDVYNNPFMLGAAVSAFYINDAATIFPKSVMVKTRAYFAGAATDVLEVGMRTEGLQEAFLKKPSLDSTDRIIKMQRVISAFSQWKSQPNNKPLVSIFIKLFGQEIAYANIDKKMIEAAIESLRKVPVKEYAKEAIKALQSGVSYHVAKPLLATEMRRFLPTSAGFPLELSLYTAVVSNAKVNVEMKSDLPDGFSLSDLLEKEVKLTTEIRPSAVVNTLAVMGVSTAQLHAGMLVRAKLNITTPVKLAATINIPEDHFKIAVLPVSAPKTIAALEAKTLVMTKTTEEPVARLTPIIQSKRLTSSSKEILSSKIVSSAADSLGESSEIISQEEQAARRNLKVRVFKLRMKYCSKLKVVGLKACLRVNSTNLGYRKDISVYKLLGSHSVALSLKPIEGEVVERLEMEVGLGQKAAEKIIKKNALSQKVREGRPMLMKLKRILAPSAGNGTVHSSSSSGSSESSSDSSSSSSQSGNNVNDTAVQLRRSRRRSSSSSRRSSSKSSSSSSKSSSSSSKSSSSSSSSKSSKSSSSSSSSKSSSSSSRSRSSSSRSSSSSSRSRSSSSRSSSSSSRSSSSSSSSHRSRSSSRSSKSSSSSSSSMSKHHHSKGHNSKGSSSARFNNSSRSSSSEDINKQKKYLGIEDAILAIVFRAVKANNRSRGFQVATYMDKPTARLQVILDPLAVDNNWRMCADGILSSKHKAMARITWGPECSKYDIAVSAETGFIGTKPAARLRVYYNRISSTLKSYAKMAAKRLSSRALASLFKDRSSNITKEFSLIVVKTSDRTFELLWKTLRRNVYKGTLQLPVTLPINEIRGRTHYNDYYDNIHFMVSNVAPAECSSTSLAQKTFNNRTYSNKMAESCEQVLAMDCTEELKFIVLLKNDREHNRINIKISDLDFDLIPKNNSVAVHMNSGELPISSNSYYEHPQEKIQVKQEGIGISVKAPTYGLNRVYFDKKSWRIEVADWMKGQTCGLCGKADGETEQEYRTSNGRVTKNTDSHALSWVLPGQSCKNECRMRQESVQLEKEVNVGGKNSRCFSVHPVLRCLPGCFPVKTTKVNVGFHCLPAGSVLNNVDISEKSVDLWEDTVAHTACRCTAQCA